MSTLELLSCALLIMISGFLSASEIALFSLSRFQLRSLKENFRPVYRKIKQLLSDPGGLLVTILVANEIVNISLSAIITQSISKHRIVLPPEFSKFIHLPDWMLQTFLGILVTAPIVLFLCEITPKVVAARMNQVVASLTASSLLSIYKSFKPLRFLLQHGLRFVLGTKSSLSAQSEVLKESEFLLMLEEGHKEGAIEQGELSLIKSVFDLDNTTVASVATPITQVQSLSISTTLKGALSAVRSQPYSRIPVVSPNKKEILGILYAKDLLRAKINASENDSPVPISTLMRKPFFVPPDMRLNALFRKFKQNRVHMAVLKNAKSEILGIVTMNDVLDCLFEDFFSEEEEQAPIPKTTTQAKVNL